MFSLLYTITSWYQNNEHKNNLNLSFTEKDLSIESRKIFDKIAIHILYYTIDNSIIIEALLKLSKIERIIIILNVLNDITLLEIAFLLDTNMNSLYVQKNSALKKLRKEFSHYFHYGILKYEEVKINDAKKHPNH